ncbi:hypothetical protein SY88_01510 [Clostridiales bacterium PH28_bin88]|nr:hypothetical protein SY88_01510 [Clostridiales bacterium PH28_bin88]
MISVDGADIQQARLEEQVRQETRLLWEQKMGSSERDYIVAYLQYLLPRELEYINLHGKPPAPRGGTLVFLVGYSLEPLLLSASLWKPERIVLVVNNTYGTEAGKARYCFTSDMLNRLAGKNRAFIVEPFIEVLRDDDPEQVFAYLQRHLAGRPDLTIDITGGKKSMVAGAFLFAAYSDTPVAYVDFDEYDANFQRPYGYKCHVTALDNPYQKFALRDWEQLKNSFLNNSFLTALELLRGIKNIPYFGDSHRQSMDSLETLLRMYRAWDNADFAVAGDFRDRVDGLDPYEAPVILRYFAGSWPDAAGEPGKLLQKNVSEIRDIGRQASEKILQKPERVYVYARDELAKARRLVDPYEDYRAALIRAAATSELLVTARVWLLRSALVPETHRKSLQILAWSISVKRRLLAEGRAEITEGKDRYQVSLEFTVATGDRMLQKRKGLLENFKSQVDALEKLAEIRNSVVHGCMPVDRKLAGDCLAIAEKDAAEFRQWLAENVKHEVYEPVPWERVKEICGLQFVPEVRRA